MRLLIVEDEPQLRQQLAAYFRRKGWVVEESGDGREALYLGGEHPYDLAVVDLGLPELAGMELIRQWRQRQLTFPVLILTARGDWQDKVAGLEAGADDYVTKPFQVEEILARANALLRRAAGRASPRGDFGPLRVDFSSRRVFRHGEELTLTTFEYNALAYLLQRRGEVVSKAELTEHLYDQDFDRDSNVIEVFIARLRRKLDPEGELKPIETLRGAGYRFALAETSR